MPADDIQQGQWVDFYTVLRNVNSSQGFLSLSLEITGLAGMVDLNSFYGILSE